MKYKLKERKGRCVQIMWEGSDKWLSTGCWTKDEAHRWAREQETPSNVITFGKYSKDFFIRRDEASIRALNELNEKFLTDTYYIDMQSVLEHMLLGFFKNIRLKDITARSVSSWKQWIKGKTTVRKAGYSADTINYAQTCLKIIMGMAVYDGLIDSNPIDGAKRMRRNPKPKNIFTKEEYDILFPRDLDALEKIWGTKCYGMIFLLLAETGFRPSEVCGLTVESIFFEERGIFTTQVIDRGSRAVREKVKTTDYGKTYKVALLSDDTCRLLKEFIDVPSGLIFHKPNTDNVNSTDLYVRLKMVLNKLDLPKDRSPYCFRHTFMTNMSARYNRDAVMELMGHTVWEAMYDHRTPQTIINQAREKLTPR